MTKVLEGDTFAATAVPGSTRDLDPRRPIHAVFRLCRCEDGLSHNEAEKISPEWAKAVADVLMHAVVETAEIVE